MCRNLLFPLYINMRKANSTEATLKKTTVEMESDVKEQKPLEPKELVDWEPCDKEITDPIETVKVILQLSDIDTEPEEWFESIWRELVRKKDWTIYLLNSLNNNVNKDPILVCISHLYSGKYAYIKKWDMELYWPVEVKRYRRRLATPLGYINIPIVTVNWTPIFFNSKWCLTQAERNIYELYNQKKVNFDRMELEKKIMWDLIIYSQLWTKTLEESKALLTKIEEEVRKTWVVKKFTFDNWIFEINFDWRMWFDTAREQPPMVLPPFTITIDFLNKRLWLRGWHPHRFQDNFCLWGALTQLKDRCFRDRDMYWLVMGMVQFGCEWNSSDVWMWDRHPWRCIIRTFEDNWIPNLSGLPVSAEEIYCTLLSYSYTYVLDTDELVNDCARLLKDSEPFRALLKQRVQQEWINWFLDWLSSELVDKDEPFIKELHS